MPILEGYVWVHEQFMYSNFFTMYVVVEQMKENRRYIHI